MSPVFFSLGSVALAFGLWYFSFAFRWGVFWFKIAGSAALLAALAWLWLGSGRAASLFTLEARDLYWGVGSALLLYLVFWVGRALATRLLPFSRAEISSVYAKRGQTPLMLIALLLLLVTGPGEELYWRGGLQTALMGLLGPWGGWLLATGLYALVHIWTRNFTLIMAALIAGLFWGGLFLITGSLTPVIISHSLWSVAIFALWPLSPVQSIRVRR